MTCDPRDRTNRYTKRHPRLLVEVLSKTTAGDDLSDKFGACRKRAVQLWRRNVHSHWELVDDRTDG